VPENTKYFEVITAKRSMLLSEEEALAGNTTISLETQAGELDNDVFTTFTEHPALLFRNIRFLEKRDQELLLSYYLLNKSQRVLGVIMRLTQTLTSANINRAEKCMAARLLFTEPIPEDIAEQLDNCGMLDIVGTAKLSEVIYDYSLCFDFADTADNFNITRTFIRPAMRDAISRLAACSDDKAKALSAYIQSLIEKKSATGKGLTARQQKKTCHLFKIDSSILGDFRIDVQHPDFDQVFVSKAIQ
jgi:hypothetical protein